MMIIDQWNIGIINFDNIKFIGATCSEETAGYDIDFWIDDRWRHLGNYKTMKRAQAVLQEIVQAYFAGEKCFYMPEE